MKERPILFSAPMVRALLAGTKTQTRRVLRDQDPIDLGASMHGAHLSRRPVFDKVAQRVIGHRMAPVVCPYGQPGDRLWVRETHAYVAHSKLGFDVGSVIYRADDNAEWDGRWKPAIHMPRDASRITLEVTAVRVERLQAISEADAIAEGIERDSIAWRHYLNPVRFSCIDPRQSYQTLWESINGEGSWDLNPWVWVVEFRRVS